MSESQGLIIPAEWPSGLAQSVRYGVVLRPPHYAWDGDKFTCDQLLEVAPLHDVSLSGNVDIVMEGNFVGVVADSLLAAQEAARRLTVTWHPDGDNGQVAGVSPIAREVMRAATADEIAVSTAERDSQRHDHEYGWPSRMGWGDVPSWIIADCTADSLRVWGQTATPETLTRDLALLTGLDANSISLSVTSPEQISGLGRHCGDDAVVDAALMSHAIGRPVAVWLDASYVRDVHALGLAQRISIDAEREASGKILRYRNRQAHAASDVPAVGLLLSGAMTDDAADEARASAPGETASESVRLFSPYVFQDECLSARSEKERNASVETGSTDDTLADVQQAFARESFLDEVAHESGQDPIALRLQHLEDPRGIELIRSVSSRAQWQEAVSMSSGPRDTVTGRGFAYSQLPDRHQRVEEGVRSAWIADVEVNRITGDVTLTRLVVGQDGGPALDTARLQQTLQARVLGEAMPLLGNEAAFDEWGDGRRNIVTPVRRDSAMAVTDTAVTDMPPGDDARLTSMSGLPDDVDMSPGVAVIANALFDATGVRFRQPPFTARRVRQGISDRDMTSAAAIALRAERPASRWLKVTALTAVASAVAVAWPWKSAIAPISRPAANVYSAQTLERGRLVAAAGDCAACHTAENGVVNAGGRSFETPFGTLFSTNLTPDEKTGIGRWSYPAFERAMRHGISRDGHNLYPAFPYTAFAKVTDADMQALYAYLMVQPAVSTPPPDNALNFPFNRRELIGGWNSIYHDSTPFSPDPTQSELYNRGAYLSEGLGHCSACHTPRNALGAERGGNDYLSGAMVDGWEAPALTGMSRAPILWSEASLYDYLREGKSSLHGVASGPMAPVVAGLAELPEYDVRAIAHYVAAQMDAPAGDSLAMREEAQSRVARSQTSPAGMEGGERLFEGACASCHVEHLVPSFSSATTSLALNTNLHSASPDNTLQTILGGVHAEHAPGVGNMPGFSDSFTDAQVVTLTRYLQVRFAPDNPPWRDVEQRVSAIREEHRNASSSHP
ncbi:MULTISPECIES: c-type cytochrome [Cobetia]|uniref:C-type cytochrome n=2 Tax=Cobetia crustatorum TaxID=553385 RepID=A0A558HMA1_9GAMM|nr:MULTISPECIES: c-type cytochrome [Cobetia]TVU70208.1 c-type cytochrome [Cobetia crustatorum]